MPPLSAARDNQQRHQLDCHSLLAGQSCQWHRALANVDSKLQYTTYRRFWEYKCAALNLVNLDRVSFPTKLIRSARRLPECLLQLQLPRDS